MKDGALTGVLSLWSQTSANLIMFVIKLCLDLSDYNQIAKDRSPFFQCTQLQVDTYHKNWQWILVWCIPNAHHNNTPKCLSSLTDVLFSFTENVGDNRTSIRRDSNWLKQFSSVSSCSVLISFWMWFCLMFRFHFIHSYFFCIVVKQNLCSVLNCS